MPNWSAGLGTSDVLSQFPSAASPLAAQGIDADEVRANPDLLQQLTGIKDQKPVNVASDGRPPEAAPQDASAKSAGATGGAGDIPSSPAPQPPQPSDQDDIAGYGKQGLGLLNKNLQAATDEAGKMSTDTPADVARLSAQQKKLETKTPLYDPQTGKMLQQYKPSTGSRIWRGVRGGLEGIAEHGIMGGLLGAIDPEKVTGTAYGAPNKQYTRAEDAREQQLGATDNELKTAMQTWKDVNDARKAKSGEYRANATLGKDEVGGASGLLNAVNKPDSEDDKANAKFSLNQREFEQRGTQADRLGLKGPQRTLFIANGKLPDPRQPTEGEMALTQATRAFTAQNGRAPQTLDEINQVNEAARGTMGKGKSGEPTVQQVRQVEDKKDDAIKKANEDFAKRRYMPGAMQDYQRDLQAVQDQYESDMSIYGRSGEHMVVSVDGKGQVKWTPQGAAAAPSAAPAPRPPAPITPPPQQAPSKPQPAPDGTRRQAPDGSIEIKRNGNWVKEQVH